jgi:hypothetical protein
METATKTFDQRINEVKETFTVSKCKIQRNVRYIRTKNYWVKITRDNDFTFAFGYIDELKAHERKKKSFRYTPNWKEAIDHAMWWLAIKEI